jgi:phage terminase Nu1 subunit (DNA packaging protein)
MFGYAEELSLSHLEAGSRTDLLDSWKEIASFFGREIRTVQLWEKREGLPVHRHVHRRRASVRAYRSELMNWFRSRQAPAPNKELIPEGGS